MKDSISAEPVKPNAPSRSLLSSNYEWSKDQGESSTPAPVLASTISAAQALRRPHLWAQRKSDLETALQDLGVDEKKARYHTKQILKWIYERKVRSIDEMTDLSKQVRAALKEKFEINAPLVEATRQVSTDGTKKVLFKLFDGHTIESVLIPAANQDNGNDEDNERLTICISSQVGCAMGCKFCLTASMGLIRNLTTEEIVGQVLELSREADITNIVFMGMGEPLHNMENVARALELLISQEGMDFSKRKVTVSTSGLVPQIRKFNARLEKHYRPNLAISLNGSNNENRGLVMPVNRAFPIEDLLEVLKEFELEPHRNITFEYVIIKNVNDKVSDADQVLKLLRGIPSKVNIIPFNPHHASPFERPEMTDVLAFQKYLNDRGTVATIRHSRGRDILAACGQLKSAEEKKRELNA